MDNLRNTVIQFRKKMKPGEVDAYSHKIYQTIIALPQFKAATHIACYLPVKNEVDTLALIRTIWEQDKNCYLPVCQPDHNLKFAEFTLAEKERCHKNQYGIPEPSKYDFIAPRELDLVITPLVVFDPKCTRTGWGQGHYDRTFAFRKDEAGNPFLLGIGYENQKVQQLTREEWDVPLDMVISERNTYTPEIAIG